jgi:two-component system, OmpR family, response regulator RegX3
MDPVRPPRTEEVARRSVLHIESDDRLTERIAGRLRQEGFDAINAHDATGGLKMSRVRRFHVIITSLERSGMNAAVCLAIRSRSANRSTPILAIAKDADEQDIVTVLDSGADDCLTVPLGMSEFIARMRALLRRGTQASIEIRGAPMKFRNIEIDRSKRLVWIGCKPIQLTYNEFELLHLMFSNPGVIMTREKLASRLWPERPSEFTRNIDALVKCIRKKVEGDRRHPRVLLTVRGVGYCAANFERTSSDNDC